MLGKEIWSDYLNVTVQLLSISTKFGAAGCTDGSFIAWRLQSGRRIVPRLLLDASTSLISLTDTYLAIVTQRGALYVWDLQELKCIVDQVSLAPILDIVKANDNSNQIRSCQRKIVSISVGTDGQPMVTLDNQTTFTFDLCMRVWLNTDEKQSKKVKLDDSDASPFGSAKVMRKLVQSLISDVNRDVQRYLTIADMEVS
jgi:hypothetical protein